MPNVVLRLVEDADYDHLFGFGGQSVVGGESGRFRDRADFDIELDRLRRDKSVVLRAVVLEGELVGSIVATDTGHVPQVSFCVDPARWNQGIATVALLAFTTMMKRRPLQARTPADNLAAIRVLEKAGFARSGPSLGTASSDGDARGEIGFELGFFPAATSIGTTPS